MPEIDSTFWTAFFSMVGGVLVTAITVWGGKKVTKRADTPKNRADGVFDGYDKLIKQQQDEIVRWIESDNRKTNRIHQLEVELMNCRDGEIGSRDSR